MIRQRYLLLAVFGILLISLIGLGYLTLQEANENESEDTAVDSNTGNPGDIVVDTDPSDGVVTSVNQGFTAKSEYGGNNTWNYTVTGSLPNPCYEASADAIVMESFPEQVIIELTVKQPASDVICTQVVEELNLEGTYSASELATMSLSILNL